MSSKSPQETINGRGILDAAAMARVLQRARSMLRDWRRRGEGPPIVAMLQPSQARLWSGVVRNCLVTGLREEAWRQTAIFGNTICDPRSAAKICGKCIRTQPLGASERANDPWRDRSLEPALKEYYGEVYRLPGDQARQFFLFSYQLAYCPKEKTIRKGGVGLYSPHFEVFADEQALLNCAREDLGSDWPSFLRRHLQPLLDEASIASITMEAIEPLVVVPEEDRMDTHQSAEDSVPPMPDSESLPEATIAEKAEEKFLPPEAVSDEEFAGEGRKGDTADSGGAPDSSSPLADSRDALSTIERTFGTSSATSVKQMLLQARDERAALPNQGSAEESAPVAPSKSEPAGSSLTRESTALPSSEQASASPVKFLDAEVRRTRAAPKGAAPSENASAMSDEVLRRVERSIQEAKQKAIAELRGYQDLTLLGYTKKQDRMMTEVEEFYRCRKAGRITFLSLHFDVFHLTARRDVASYKREHGTDALRRSPDAFDRFGPVASQAVAGANAIFSLEDWLSERLGRSILPHRGASPNEALAKESGVDGWYDAEHIYLDRSTVLAALGGHLEEPEALGLLEENQLLASPKSRKRFWSDGRQDDSTPFVALRRPGLSVIASAVTPSLKAL